MSKKNDESINLYNIQYDNYIVEGTEGSLTVLKKKNDFSKSQAGYQKSSVPIQRTQSSKISMSKTANRLPSKEELDQNRMDAFKSRYLLHKYQNIDQATNPSQILKEIKKFKDNGHAALAELYRYSMNDPNGEKRPCILTERPINSTLYSFISYNSQSESSMTSDSDIDLLSIDEKETSVINERFDTNNFKFTPEHKFLLIVGIVAGIESIHRKGKVHGHLNPRNIYLDEKFLPKICGYGFIQPIDCGEDDDDDDDDSSVKNFGILTDTAFIPQEILKGKAIYQESDIYSIGKLILYILSEIDPYKNNPKQQKTYQKSFITFPECISVEWKNIILRCLEVNPKSRIKASDLLSKLLKEENISKLISTIPNSNKKSMYESFSQAAPEVDFDEYIRYIISHFNFDDKFQDNYIIRDMVPDPTVLSEEVKSLISDASEDDPESLLKVGKLFLKGEQNIPKQEENAFELIKKSADLGNKEGMKLVAELYKKGTGTQVDYDDAISYYKKALKKCENESAKNDIKEKISEIEKMKKKEMEPNQTDDDDLEILNEPDDEKERLNEKVRIQIRDVPKQVTKDDIENIFDEYENISIQMTTYGIYESAYIYFRDEADKKRFARKYRRKGSNINIKHNKLKFEGLPKTQKEKDRDREMRKKKLLKGMPLGASLSPPSKSKDVESSSNIQKYEINNNDFYPGKGKDKYKKIGKGQYGKVYKAYRKSNDQILVAKVFKTSFESSSERKNFLREIKALVDINHPLIIKFYGFNPYSLIVPTKKCATIFLEYMPNGTLQDVIKQESEGNEPEWWNNTTKIKTLIGIANAMAYMHRAGYIHRDLKPDNIFFDANHEIKIGDFGFSRKYDKKNEVIMTFDVGTPVYNAPEIFMPENLRYSWEVDVFSFSIIMYQILLTKRIEEIYPKVTSKKTLQRMVVRGKRPEIPENKKNKLLFGLMKKCWSGLVDERPSFNFIYKFFKNNYEQETPLSFLPDVDIDDIRNYFARLDGDE